MAIGAVASLAVGSFTAFVQDCDAKPDEVLRLHILANSDSEEDQSLKYDLRDHMLTEFSDIFSGCDTLDEAIAEAESHTAEMQQSAQEYIISRGYDYVVTCELEECYFTTRSYGSYTLPAGDYTAVRFIIGEGEGKNWWCVMFPPLCLPAAGEFFTEEQSRQVESTVIEPRFALFEWIQSLFF
ncbi:MAG: stage II sporulation protein R [Eubacterium sp.]|nr:stage II sporulation protein R [Eubacterium sp.]